MKDNEINRLLVSIISAGLQEAGYANTRVAQAFEPTQQGVATYPTVYYFKLGDKRYGFLNRTDRWDAQAEKEVHTETQLYETSFQISALVIQNPKTPTQLTASDLVNEVAAIMQSDKTSDILKENGLGILRVTEIRNPFFIDDKDRFEASPSFDFTLTHRQTRISETPVIESVELDLKRV